MKDFDARMPAPEEPAPEEREEAAEGAQRKLSPFVEQKIEEIKALARELDAYKRPRGRRRRP